jgi:hypothetical protein
MGEVELKEQATEDEPREEGWAVLEMLKAEKQAWQHWGAFLRLCLSRHK